MTTVASLKSYRDRWKAVEEIERQELRSASIETHWKELNAILRLGIGLGLSRDGDDEMVVYDRWAKLKGGQ